MNSRVLEDAFSLLSADRRLGEKRLPNGVRLIGHVPHVAPVAYLHVIFPGLDDKKLRELEVSAGRAIPASLRKFYEIANGVELFSGALSIFGLRHHYVRAGDAAMEPFGIDLKNKDERPVDASRDMLFFGFYDWDGSLLYMSAAEPVVYRCSAESVAPLSSWESIDVMFASEVRRLSGLFDADGRKIDPEIPTVPTHWN